MRMFRLFALSLLAASSGFASIQDPLPGEAPPIPTRGFSAGQFIPDVELPRIDGLGTLRLSDFATKAPGTEDEVPGKKLLLIHFASW